MSFCGSFNEIIHLLVSHPDLNLSLIKLPFTGATFEAARITKTYGRRTDIQTFRHSEILKMTAELQSMLCCLACNGIMQYYVGKGSGIVDLKKQ